MGRDAVEAWWLKTTATVKKSHALRLLTLRLSTLFHFIVAEEHDKSVVPPYEEAASSFAAMRVHTMPCLSALETASVCERTWSLR
jgi:hypothetical protein